jgi:hypothetical protein
MSSEMNLIMENWRKSVVLAESKKDLFENTDYIQEVLGIDIPLNENNEPVISEELRQQIQLEENFLTNWVRDAYEGVKKTGGQLKNLGEFLLLIIKDPKAISFYVQAVKKSLLLPMKKKLMSMRQTLREVRPVLEDTAKRAATLFQQGVEKLVGIVDRALAMTKGWKSALMVTGVVVGGYYLFDKIKDLVPNPLELTGLDKNATIRFIKAKAEGLIELFAKKLTEVLTKLVGENALKAAAPWISGLMTMMKIAVTAADVLEEPIKAAKSRIKGANQLARSIAASTS